MKLEPNMYVRTKNGMIAKFRGWNAYDENKVAIHTHNEGDIEITPVIDKNTIIKASHNIIALIEVGDYVSTVTGECAVIAGVYNDINSKKYLRLCNCIGDYYEDNIKSIITHEQMEQIAYKVGE